MFMLRRGRRRARRDRCTERKFLQNGNPLKRGPLSTLSEYKYICGRHYVGCKSLLSSSIRDFETVGDIEIQTNSSYLSVLNDESGSCGERGCGCNCCLWDIEECPVPPGYDACRVVPCLKRFLKELGYSGPLLIFVTGLMTNVPNDVLRALSSTGIALHHVRDGSGEMATLALDWTYKNPPPANVMFISLPSNFSYPNTLLREKGYNTILLPFPFDSPNEAPRLWNEFLLADLGQFEEDNNSSETSEFTASWVCSVCDNVPGQGFENFLTHLSSREHKREDSWHPVGDDYLPYGKDKEAFETREPMDAEDLAEAELAYKQRVAFRDCVFALMKQSKASLNIPN